MRRILTFCAFGAVFSALALAESWTGKLIDSPCFEAKKDAATCDAGSSTSMFAIAVSGKVYKLDEQGNAKALEAIKSRADRATDPSKAAGAITAKVTGAKGPDNTLKVESVEVQ